MDEEDVAAAKRRVAWLMVPVVIVGLLAIAILVLILWVATNPGCCWDA